jgi:iron complex outermembrane recepter protein
MNITLRRCRLLWASSASLASVIAATGFIAVPTAAYAQSTQTAAQTAAPDTLVTTTTGLEEIVVTAQRRSEKMVDVPISITALSSEQLATANVQNLADIQQLTPSLRFDNQVGFFQPTIRGIGTAVTTSGGGSNVGIYINGFYSPNPLAADFQLMNVTDVQVLKGPQGTLFGHNTTGGAILVTTAEPSAEPHAEAKISYGSYNAQRFQGYGTTGLGSIAALDVEGIFTKGNGFITNIVDDDNHVGAYQDWSVRTGLKLNFSDKVSAVLRYTLSREDDPTAILTNSNTDTTIDPTTGKPWGVTTLQAPGLYTTNPNQVANNLPTFITSDTNIAQLTVKADLNFADLTSYSQWRRENVNQSENLDQTGLPIFQLGLPIDNSTISQEFLLTSKPGTRLQWTAGAFYFTNKDEWFTFIDNFSNTPVGRVTLGGSGSTTENIAGFFDATYALTPDKWFLTVGARYSHDTVKDAFWDTPFTTQHNYEPDINSDKVTPRVVLRYKPTDQSSVYASYTEGYKAAIIDVGGSCQDGPAYQCNPIHPEDVHAFEVGYKLESHTFSNQVAAFYYDYKNLQVSEFLGAAQAYIVNAASSKIYGLEDELHWQVVEHVEVNGGASWTHARYETFGTTVNGVLFGAPIYASCPADTSTLPPKYQAYCGPGSFAYVNQDTILHGAHMQHVPDWTATLGPRFTTGPTHTGEYSVSANIYYTSEFYFSPSGTQFLQPSYTTVALRTEWKDPSRRYTVALYGENLTDARYRTQVQENGFGIGASWSAPTTWGIELGAKF